MSTSTSSPQLPEIALLGVGSMLGAILGGIVASSANVADGVPGGIRATNRSSEKARILTERFGDRVRALAEGDDPEANRHAADGAGLVIVGVKPIGVVGVLDQIADALTPGTVLVSVAAGVTIDTIREHVPAHVAVLRAMPNTPAQVGLGVTGLSAGPGVTDAQRALARAVFETVGDVFELEEERIDLLSAVSGSGPAYVFAYIEQLEQAAQQLGFTADEARRLVEGTVIGSTKLLVETGETPSKLREQVTSPGGTTAAALAVITRGGQVENLTEALRAAVARSEELAAESR